MKNIRHSLRFLFYSLLICIVLTGYDCVKLHYPEFLVIYQSLVGGLALVIFASRYEHSE